MTEYLIMLVPGLIGAICFLQLKKEKKSWLKILGYTLVLDACSNIAIRVTLYMIGMHEFRLADMGLSFKIKYLVLGIVFACGMALMAWNVRNFRKGYGKQVLKTMFPATLFLIITYAVFTPSSLFLGNTEEFRVHYADILPIILGIALVMYLIVNGIALLIFGGRFLGNFSAFVFSIALGVYVQGNFLNPQFPTMDGTDLNWSVYQTQIVISSVFWIVCVVGCQALYVFGKTKAEKIMKYAAYFITAVQVVSLLTLILTSGQYDAVNYGYTKEGEFSVGTDENIIIFVVDCMDATALETHISEDEKFADKWRDFTFFSNAVSGGAPTIVAMPLLLTGIEYDPTYTSIEDYLGEVWKEADLYRDLEENEYDVRFYSDFESICGVNESIVDNIGVIERYYIGDYKRFADYLYKLTNLYTMPQVMKEEYWFATSEIQETITTPDDIYSINDVQFYQDLLKEEKIGTDYQKSLRVYHLYGVHLPYNMTENVERMPENTGTEKQQLKGVLKEVELYLDMLKASGVYEQSTIIVTGDHGQHQEGSLETNPGILIKKAYQEQDFSESTVPIHFRNVVATMASTFSPDYSAYGPSVYDITHESDVERYHTVDETVRKRAFAEELNEDVEEYSRYLVSEDAKDVGGYVLYEPDKINRLSYTLGDVIDFTQTGEYTDDIHYRVYKENGVGIASNELTLCFELEKDIERNLELHFVYADLYNESQTVEIYANGRKVEDAIYTKEQSGQEHVVVIPKECMEDTVLVLRMVFPNAVTPHQLDPNDPDTRVLSVAFETMYLK